LWQFPADRTDLVYLCVTPIRDCRTPDFPDNVPVVLSPYNLEPRKNLKALLEAVASAKVPFTLVLCGRAAWTEEREQFFQKEVSCLGLAHRIHLTGPLTDPELNGWYRRANIFVFPSLYEGFRLPVLEAMTAGRCVLVHNDSAMAKLWTAPRAIHRSAMSWAARLMPARSHLPASG
jgi:glycosyltransferase involved in cell wall biosynthesis